MSVAVLEVLYKMCVLLKFCIITVLPKLGSPNQGCDIVDEKIKFYELVSFQWCIVKFFTQ